MESRLGTKTRILYDYAMLIIGTAIYAVGVTVFVRSAEVPLGGISGISLLINTKTGFPMGTLTIIFNVPLFILGYRQLGREFIIRTIVATVLSSVFIDLISNYNLLPVYNENKLLSALYGGVMMGASFGIIFGRGGTLGGTDILTKLIVKKWSHRSMGMVTLYLNVVVILVAAAVYRDLWCILYALILQFASAKVCDGILNGEDIANMAFIVTQKPEEVAAAILENINRGVTSLDAKGMYTQEEKAVLLCAFRSHELTKIKRTVIEADASAFMMLTNANEVVGKGFKVYGQ